MWKRISLKCLLLITLAVVRSLGLITLPTMYSNDGWNPMDYPDPFSNHTACHSGKVKGNESWICDPDGLLSKTAVARIEHELTVAHNRTKCTCTDDRCSGWGGFRFGVAMVYKMSITWHHDTNDEQRAQDFAHKLRNQWFKDIGCNDNVLIFLAKWDRQLQIATGRQAKSYLTDGEVDDVFKAVKDYFKDEDYETGIIVTIKRLVDDLNDVRTGKLETVVLGAVFGVVALLTGVCCIVCCVTSRCRWESQSINGRTKDDHVQRYRRGNHSSHSSSSISSHGDHTCDDGGGGGGGSF
ncbi:uncharacterized protein [Ptychodera flava]|uniref:uncharacterized protein n=1 Tax=Ptychodera flava TaxID=63121 RepID=UPI003969E883